MIVKVITLFLIFMVVLAMFGRLRLRKPNRKCRSCRAPIVGAGPCPCGKE
jgi:hypothetical protein